MSRQVAKRTPIVRILAPDDEAPVALVATRGRVSAATVLVNDGPAAVSLPQVEVRAHLTEPARVDLGGVAINPSGSMVVAPGANVRVSLTASLDRLTPPGRYEAEIVIDGRARHAVLHVGEDIDLQLSESEFVVSADPDAEQVRSVLLTNAGNVPLPVRVIGPAELEPDRPVPSLLERLGVLRSPHTAVAPREPRGDRDRGRDPDDPDRRPTVTGRIREPVTVGPGETVPCELAIKVDGPIASGARYRATAPLYLTDVTFVVTPNQESRELADESKPSRAREPAIAEREPGRPPAASPAPEERRD